MRYLFMFCVILMLSVAGICELYGQSMHVWDTSGTQFSYSLGSIANLHFVSGELRIKKQDNITDVYALGSLRYLNFSDSTSVRIETEEEPGHQVRMYPNPVADVLMVDLSEASGEKGSLHILGLDGKVVMSRKITGPGIVRLDLSSLHRGLYICRILMQEETSSTKIFKQ